MIWFERAPGFVDHLLRTDPRKYDWYFPIGISCSSVHSRPSYWITSLSVCHSQDYRKPVSLKNELALKVSKANEISSSCLTSCWQPPNGVRSKLREYTPKSRGCPHRWKWWRNHQIQWKMYYNDSQQGISHLSQRKISDHTHRKWKESLMRRQCTDTNWYKWVEKEDFHRCSSHRNDDFHSKL